MNKRAIGLAVTVVIVISGGFLLFLLIHGMGLDFSASLLHSQLIVIIVLLILIYIDVSLKDSK